MTKLDRQTLEDVAQLCRINYSKQDKESLLVDLASILGYIKLLDEVDTEGIAPCDHVLETMQNVMRIDQVDETLQREVFLENSPSHVGGMVRVPPVIKF